jgi:DNA uptake protein ComE-like DNA-binding protein
MLITFIVTGYKVYELYTRASRQPVEVYNLSYASTTSQQDVDTDSNQIVTSFKGQIEGKIRNITIGAFNPNNQPIDFWIKVGLTPKQAAVIKRYEAAGGYFRNAADVQKMKVISPEVYKRIEPLLMFEPERVNNRVNSENSDNVLINSADSAELLKLKGIRPYLAGRIIKYRNRIGGFYSAQQLTGVYGVTDSIVKLNSSRIDTSGFKPIRQNLNTAGVKELLKVGGLTYETAIAIVRQREKYGFFRDVTDLRKLNLVNEELYTKIAPYLTAGLNNP